MLLSLPMVSRCRPTPCLLQLRLMAVDRTLLALRHLGATGRLHLPLVGTIKSFIQLAVNRGCVSGMHTGPAHKSRLSGSSL